MTRTQLLRELEVLPDVFDFWVLEFGDCGLIPTADGDFETPAVRMAFFLKRLLREEGFTLWGARRRLQGCVFSMVPQAADRPRSETEPVADEAGRRTRELIALLDEHLQSP